MHGEITSVLPPATSFDEWTFTLSITIMNPSAFEVRAVTVDVPSEYSTNYVDVSSVPPHSSESTTANIKVPSPFGGGEPNPNLHLSLLSFDAENGIETFRCG
jgi:hypothetical protein